MQPKQRIKRSFLAIILVAVIGVCSLPFVAYAEGSTVEVSADGRSAKLESSGWALDDFSRAQVGSNRTIDDQYYGYLFYVSDVTDSVHVLVLDDYAVAYVPESVAADLGFDVEDKEHQSALKELFRALDEEAARGSSQLTEIETWHFTTEQKYSIDRVVIGFDQELQPGEFYVSISGENGEDVTDAGGSPGVTIQFSDTAQLVSTDEVELAVAAEGWDALVEFLQGIDYSPLWVTLKTTGTAIVFIFILGLAAAYFSLRIPPRAQDVADSVFTIPMVLPPTVCGFILLLAFGNNSLIGRWFMDIGFPLVFSWQATVLAAIVVAFPLMYRSARGAFENLDTNMLDAARTLGWSNRKIFFKLMLPLSWSSIAAGTVLAFARALGEFGATLFLAGNYVGITRTIPIAIYFDWMGGKKEEALFWAIVIIVISFIVILFINLWGRRTTKYRRGSEE